MVSLTLDMTETRAVLSALRREIVARARMRAHAHNDPAALAEIDRESEALVRALSKIDAARLTSDVLGRLS